MNRWNVFVCLSLLILPLEAAGTRKTGLTVPVKYDGGTLQLSQGKVTATITEVELVLNRGDRKILVPLENITALTCSTDVRRRFGAGVLGVVPLVRLDTVEQHYIGLTWTSDARDGGKPGKVEAVLKVSGGEYRDLLAALERLTGRKAVDTGKVPMVVRYEI